MSADAKKKKKNLPPYPKAFLWNYQKQYVQKTEIQISAFIMPLKQEENHL